MLHRLVRLSVYPEFKEEFEEHCRARNPLENQIEGCLEFGFFEDKKTPGVYFTFSIWIDEIHLENYRNSTYFKTTWGILKPLFKEKASAFSLNKII